MTVRLTLRHAACLLFLVMLACGDPEHELPGLIKQLKSADTHERVVACRRLGWFGKRSDKAVRFIEPLLYDRNPGIQAAAAYALDQIATPTAKKALERIDPHAKERPELYK